MNCTTASLPSLPVEGQRRARPTQIPIRNNKNIASKPTKAGEAEEERKHEGTDDREDEDEGLHHRGVENGHSP